MRLTREDYLMITERRGEGAFIKDIANELGVHPKTVSRSLVRGSEPPKRKVGKKATKLEPFKAQIDDFLSNGVWNAAVILRRLHAVGYQGSYTILRQYIQPKRALRPKGVVRYETPAGHQLQHDWADCRLVIGGTEQMVHLAVNVLGFSRALHVVAMPCMDAEHTYEALCKPLCTWAV